MTRDQLSDSMDDRWHMLHCFATPTTTEAVFMDRDPPHDRIEITITEPNDDDDNRR